MGLIAFIVSSLAICLSILFILKKKQKSKTEVESSISQYFGKEIIEKRVLSLSSPVIEETSFPLNLQPSDFENAFCPRIAFIMSKEHKKSFEKLKSELLSFAEDSNDNKILINGFDTVIGSGNFNNHRVIDKSGDDEIFDIEAIKFGNFAGTLYIYPQMILSTDNQKISKSMIIGPKSFTFKTESKYDKESEVPRGATISYTTWLHSRKDGGPDRRFSVNYRICYYNTFQINCKQIGLIIKSANKKKIDNIHKLFKDI